MLNAYRCEGFSPKERNQIFCPVKLILIQEYERWSVGIDFSGETDTSPAVKICHPPYDSN